MQYQLAADSKIYLNEDELNSEKPEYDYIIVAPSISKYLMVGSFEARVWELLSQGKDITQIITELSLQEHKFEDERVHQIIDRWYEIGLLRQVGQAEKASQSWWERISWVELPLKNINGYLQVVYRLLGKYFFTKLGAFLIGLYVLVGLGLLVTYFVGDLGGAALPRPNFLLILASITVCLFFHELAHGLAMVWAKASVDHGGMAFYLGFPVFFVDTSSVWSRNKFKRIVTSLAGIVMNLVIISSAAILLYLNLGEQVSGYLFELIMINSFTAGFSMIPFLKMDGYYVLIDLIGLPNLDKIAVSEVWQLFKNPLHIFSRQKYFYLFLYGIVNILSSAGLTLYSIWYWSGWARYLLQVS